MVQKAIRSGESPFWIDGEYCGQPTMLLQEAPLIYPLTVPLLATGAPPHRLADLFTLFHFWLAGFAVYLLLRDLGADVLSGLFAGVAWMLCARLVQSALWPNAVAVSALFPFLLMGLLRICRGELRSGVVMAGLSGGLSLSAFRPQVLIGAAPILIAVVAAGFLTARRRSRALADVALAALLACALGSPALLPSLALYPSSSRAGGLDPSERNLSPITFGGDLDQVFLPVDGGVRWPEAAAYPGLATAVLFFAGCFFAFRRASFPRLFFAAITIGGLFGLLLAMGEGGPYRLIADLPILRSLRIPARFLFSWSLALVVGAGLALSYILQNTKRRRLVGALLLVALSGDLVWHARVSAPTAPSEIYTVEPAIVKTLRERLSADEVGFPRRFWTPVLPVNFPALSDSGKVWAARWLEPLSLGLGMRFGLESVQGHGPTLDRTEALGYLAKRTMELTGAACVVRWRPRSVSAAQKTQLPPGIAISWFTPLPRALLFAEAVSVPAHRAVSAVLDPALDPRRTAVVEDAPGLARQPGWNAADSSVRLVSRASGRVKLSVRLPDEGVLVLFQAYEKGWKVRVDGRTAPVFRADAAFLGVRLMRGDHEVTFEYRPRGLTEGFLLAGIGLVGIVLTGRRSAAAEESIGESV